MEIQYHDKQIEALHALSVDSNIRQLLYGGSAGSGKSFLGCDWQIKRRLKYAGTRGLIGRAELKKLRLSTMATFFELCASYGLAPGKHYTYNGQDHIIKSANSISQNVPQSGTIGGSCLPSLGCNSSKNLFLMHECPAILSAFAIRSNCSGKFFLT